MTINQSIQKSLLIILLSTVVFSSIQAGWEGMLNSLNQLSFNQKLAIGASFFAVTGYATKYLYKKRLAHLKSKRYEERQRHLLPLLEEARNVSFYNFKNKCAELKEFVLRDVEYYEERAHKGSDVDNDQTALTAQEFHQILDRYFKILLYSDVFERTNWVNQKIAIKIQEALTSMEYPAGPSDVFDPYVQKLVLPQGSKVIFFGDRHGDVHSLLKSLQDLCDKGYLDKENPFLISDQNVYIGFLGDWTDRGWYGADVMAAILSLWSANPHNVFLVRGNHEDLFINQKESRNGFMDEIKKKFPHDCEKSEQGLSLVQKIALIYETLPLAAFVGCKDSKKSSLQALLSYFCNNDKFNYALCCHGGVELGYNAIPLLKHESSIAFGKLGMLRRKLVLDKICSCSESLKKFKEASKNSQNPIISPQDLTDIKALKIPEEQLQDFIPTQIKSIIYRTRKGEYSTKQDDPCDMGVTSVDIGFGWNDVDPDESHEKNEGVFAFKGMRAWTIGKTLTQAILNWYSTKYHIVRGVFRGHQHTNDPKDQMMIRILNSDDCDHTENKGVGRLWLPNNVKDLPPKNLWNNFVYTFNVSPNTPYQTAGFKFDTYGILTLGNKFEDWSMDVIRV